MARKPYKKIFGNKKKLGTMLTLRSNGWTYMSLALLYDVDYSSIYHECKKYHIARGGEDAVDFSIRHLLSDLGIRVKKVKMYEDYLRDAGYKSQVYWEKISL